MSPNESIKKRQTKVWLALRFILFGFPGFWVMLYCAMVFFGHFFESNQDFISPFLSLPLSVIGALSMLYGVGEWGRWAYLWVFYSIPASLCLLIWILPGTGSKLLPVIVVAAAAFAVHAGVRAYYDREVRGMRDRKTTMPADK